MRARQNAKGATALKSRGEDITAGKVTFPLLKAIPRLPKDEMQRLWETVRVAVGVSHAPAPAVVLPHRQKRLRHVVASA